MPTKLELLAVALADKELAKLPHDEAVDRLNHPRKTGTEVSYRPVTYEEFDAATGVLSRARLAVAKDDFRAATLPTAELDAAPGVAVKESLTVHGHVIVEPGTQGYEDLVAAAEKGFLTTDELDRLVEIGTVRTPIMQSWWQENGVSNVRIAEVISVRTDCTVEEAQAQLDAKRKVDEATALAARKIEEGGE